MANKTSLTQSNVSGWGFALPAFALMVTFIILPFFFAIWFSLTNQRLISPNPAKFVGLSNYTQLLSVGTILLEPERDEQGAIMRTKDGEIKYPRLRKFTRKNPDYPNIQGMREWFSWQTGPNDEFKRVILAKDVVFMRALKTPLCLFLSWHRCRRAWRFCLRF